MQVSYPKLPNNDRVVPRNDVCSTFGAVEEEGHDSGMILLYSLQIAAALIVGLVVLITVRTRGVQVHGH